MRNTYSTEAFESGLIRLRDLKAGFSLFRFENDEQRYIVACFIASQHATTDGKVDDELYRETHAWLLPEYQSDSPETDEMYWRCS